MSRSKSKKETKSQGFHREVVPELISYGFVVIPLDNKKPIHKRWNKLTHTPEQLYIFEGYNIGILTGQVSGLTVLDIDIKDDGLKLWNNLSNAYPEIVTPMAITPSGGLHLYFRYNKNLHSFSRFKLRNKKIGWDLLNNERQVAAPPSINPITKKSYKWAVSPSTVKPIIMPKWLEEYLINVKSFH